MISGHMKENMGLMPFSSEYQKNKTKKVSGELPPVENNLPQAFPSHYIPPGSEGSEVLPAGRY